MIKLVTVILFASLLTSCGGGESSTNSPPTPAPTPTTPPTPIVKIVPADAARFLNHATFGAKMSEINTLADTGNIETGFENWINAQFAIPTSSEVTYLTALEPTLSLAANEQLWHEHRVEAWFTHALTAPDQLRQRVAFALSEIFVVSDDSAFGDDTYGLAQYYDLLADNAFANYRDLLENVTLSPIMGMYLSMLGNEKPNDEENIRPDENYAREVMQLFSIGLVQLNLDGSPKLVNGNTVATYDQAMIKAYAHVYTGWNFNGTTAQTWGKFYRNYNTMEPMTAVEAFHDTGEKQLLNGMIVPANQSAKDDLKMALDSLYNHPNVGPFISKQLIQRLVTSNPTAEYIARVATIFNDNGQGVRGDLAAVIKTILLDDEALNGYKNSPTTFGKIREPLLRATHLWRAFDATSPSERFQMGYPEYFFKQAPLSAPHVFNFFSPSYAPPGVISSSSLVAPELEIATENYFTRTSNFFAYSTFFGNTDMDPADIEEDRILINLEQLKPFADDTDKLLDYLNILLFSGNMGDEARNIFKNAYQQTSEDEITDRLTNLLFLMMVSPQYAVQQ
jgi:uncharacterized protein (DUF1800 family)